MKSIFLVSDLQRRTFRKNENCLFFLFFVSFIFPLKVLKGTITAFKDFKGSRHTGGREKEDREMVFKGFIKKGF